MTAEPPRERISYEAYLQLAAASDEGLEYHDGVVVAMGATTPAHARLCTRLTVLLSDRLSAARRRPLGVPRRRG